MRLGIGLLTAALLLAACGDGSGGGGAAPAPGGGTFDPEVAEKTRAVADSWMAGAPPQALEWDWGDGVLTFALLELAEVTGEAKYSDYVRDYVEFHQDRGVVYFWNDNLTPALSAALLILREGAPFEPILQGAEKYLFEDAPRTPSGGIRHLGFLPFFFVADLWVDSLFHFVPLMARISELRGTPDALNDAASQLLIFARAMQDPATGLFTHAYIDSGGGAQVPRYDEGAFWARGNGWVIAAMADLLSRLPADHPDRAELLERCLALEAALRAYQDPGGRYHTLLFEPGTYLETAASGLITYGMARGVREGIFGDETRDAAGLGMEGLFDALVEDEERGTLVDFTSLGTVPIAATYPRVNIAKQVVYGVGAWILAGTEYMRE